MPGFSIDESKFRGALPPPTSSRGEDLKWSGAVIGIVAGVVAVVALFITSLLHLV